jgi:hypothetical protein
MDEEYQPPVMWFRYHDPWITGEEPWLQEIPVARETPKCVVLDEYGRERYVLKDARKRYAYPTKELALDSYIIRKQRQIQHAAATHDAAKENLETAEAIKRGEKKPRPALFQFTGGANG